MSRAQWGHGYHTGRRDAEEELATKRQDREFADIAAKEFFIQPYELEDVYEYKNADGSHDHCEAVFALRFGGEARFSFFREQDSNEMQFVRYAFGDRKSSVLPCETDEGNAGLASSNEDRSGHEGQARPNNYFGIRKAWQTLIKQFLGRS